MLAILWPALALAQDVRVATYNAELSRKGPGLLLRDILSGKDDQISAVIKVISASAPDILALQGFDHDLENHALRAFQSALKDAGHPMEFAHSTQPNAGLATGLDMDGNGRTGEARDAQGYGRFTGQGGMAVLSRFPLGEVRDFTQMLWRDLPDAIPPMQNGQPFPSLQAFEAQRLSSVAHWDVPVFLPNGTVLHLLTFHATTPVFDGDEDRNGRRNHDEIAFWQHYLNGALPITAPEGPVVIAGDANLDPTDGDGRRDAIRSLLRDPRLQDPMPARATAEKDGTAFDTVDWPEPDPGNLRVSYVLPDARLRVSASGVVWPQTDDPFLATVELASRHRLVWVDLRF